MAAMAGGIAGSGGPCGALTGAVAFLGSVLGKEKPEQSDDPLLWKACARFYRRFQKEVGSINCRDITGVDWSDPEQTRAFYQGDGVAQCAANTGKAGRILGEMMDQYLDPGG
jgi:C_GCAxxG_C_C family probable redox protein